MSSYPTPPEQPPSRPVQQPSSIRTAVMLVWAIVAVSIVNLVLSFAFIDDIVAASGTDLSESEQDAARTVALISAVVFGLVFAVLWALMGYFLGKGKNWARIVLTILAVLGVLGGLFGFVGDQPAVLLVTGIITLLLELGLLYFMWQKESSAFLQAR